MSVRRSHYRRTFYDGKPADILCDSCYSIRINVKYTQANIVFTCRKCGHVDKMPRYESANPEINRRLSEVT